LDLLAQRSVVDDGQPDLDGRGRVDGERALGPVVLAEQFEDRLLAVFGGLHQCPPIPFIPGNPPMPPMPGMPWPGAGIAIPLAVCRRIAVMCDQHRSTRPKCCSGAYRPLATAAASGGKPSSVSALIH